MRIGQGHSAQHCSSILATELYLMLSLPKS
uniref:Uncharacterized protein n=1 Tax=Anguilla anguilla TaxID=7936 RepID=A0A0E9TGK7_ANGAN